MWSCGTAPNSAWEESCSFPSHRALLKGWTLPLPGKASSHTCSLLHWDGLPPEQPLRQAPASRRPRQTCKSSRSPPHIYGASLDFILMGENPGGVTGLT